MRRGQVPSAQHLADEISIGLLLNSSISAILSSVIVISLFHFESRNPNLSRRSTMAASITPGRALRYGGAPRAASYTNGWETIHSLAPKA